MIGDHYFGNVGMPIKATKIEFKNILSSNRKNLIANKSVEEELIHRVKDTVYLK